MIIVVLGGVDKAQRPIVEALLQLGPENSYHLSVSGLAQALVNSRLKKELGRKVRRDSLTVLTGTLNNQDLACLRQNNAVICHCYGHLDYRYGADVSIHPSDFMAALDPERDLMPGHVLAPDELLSEAWRKVSA